MKSGMTVRSATRADAAEIARIYSEGIEDRVATFEVQPRTEVDVLTWFARRHAIIVVEEEEHVTSFAATSPSSGRCC